MILFRNEINEIVEHFSKLPYGKKLPDPKKLPGTAVPWVFQPRQIPIPI